MVIYCKPNENEYKGQGFGNFRISIVSAVPVRTASNQPYRLQKFKLRLCYASDVRQPNVEVITAIRNFLMFSSVILVF